MQTVLVQLFGAALALAHVPADTDTRPVIEACDAARGDGWATWHYERGGAVWCVAFTSDKDRP